jgi:SAM-dependent methyltransferase
MSSVGTDLTLIQEAALNFLSKAAARLGKPTVRVEETDFSKDLWYNYMDVGLTSDNLQSTWDSLIPLGLVAWTEDSYLLTPEGSSQKEVLTAAREALATLEWQKDPVAEGVRKALYREVNLVLSGREDSKDVAFFNTLSRPFAEVIRKSYFRTATMSGRNILDFGCGMSGLTDVLMQREDGLSNRYWLVDSSKPLISELDKKHEDHPFVTSVCADHRNFREKVSQETLFDLILIIDMLYFINPGSARADLILLLLENLRPGGELVMTLNARPQINPDEAASIGVELPIEHAKSGLSEVYAAVSSKPDFTVTVESRGSEGYWGFWEHAKAVFDGSKTPSLSVKALQYQTDQALAFHRAHPESPAGSWAVIVQRNELPFS